MARKTTKPKKRTRTAIAARKYERKLKQRVKAGEKKALEIVERRRKYNEDYEAKRQKQREARRKAAKHGPVQGAEDVLRRACRDDHKSIAGSSNDVEDQEDYDVEKSELFCTPPPPRRVSQSRTRTRENVAPTVPAATNQQCDVRNIDVGSEDSGPSHLKAPTERHRQSWPTPVFPRAKEREVDQRSLPDPRGRLVRLRFGGALASLPPAASLRRRPKENQEDGEGESVEKLELLLLKIRRTQERLREEEIEAEIKLRQRRERDDVRR